MLQQNMKGFLLEMMEPYLSWTIQGLPFIGALFRDSRNSFVGLFSVELGATQRPNVVVFTEAALLDGLLHS
jgi:hypothetical protein